MKNTKRYSIEQPLVRWTHNHMLGSYTSPSPPPLSTEGDLVNLKKLTKREEGVYFEGSVLSIWGSSIFFLEKGGEGGWLA